MNILIAYDIKDDKNRKKLADILGGFGLRVNYSVFELQISKKELNKLLTKIKENQLFKKSDSIRVYHICNECVSKSFELNSNLYDPFEQESFFV